MTYVEVTHVESESDDHGLRVEIRLNRFPDNISFANTLPIRTDIPSDFREALLEWLTG